MIPIILMFVASAYLLYFVISNHLGGWMIASYIRITIPVLALICHAVIGIGLWNFLAPGNFNIPWR